MAATTSPAPTAGTELPPSTDDIDRGFGLAIVVGAIFGIIAMSALMTGITYAIDPDMGWGAAAAVGVWCGIWAGLFLGGTVKVGRWSAKHYH